MATLEAAIAFLEQQRQTATSVDPLGDSEGPDDSRDDGSKDNENQEANHGAGGISF